MKALIIFCAILISSALYGQVQSDFFFNCKCFKLEIEEGLEIKDSLHKFSVVFPNENWNPTTFVRSGNGTIGALVDGDSFKTFSITVMEKDDAWMTPEEAQADIASKFNVIESGKISIDGVESIWNLIDFQNEPFPSLTLFITTEHPQENLFYTINLSVSKDKYGRKELCELENLVHNIRIK